MSELYPIPPDVRKRIEKWLKEHVDETSSSDDVPCVVVNEGSGFTASLLDKLIPRRLSPTASATLAAKMESMREEPFANELNRWLERGSHNAFRLELPLWLYKQYDIIYTVKSRRRILHDAETSKRSED